MTQDTSAVHTSLPPQTVRLIHDMRNGLASMRAAAHALSRSSSDPALVARAVEDIQSQVKEMVTLMDVFVNEFACHERAPEPVKRPAHPDGNGNSLQVLIADDNVDAANTLATWLRMQGHRTVVAFDGETAWQLAEDDHPDVMLLDISMPQLDGYELAQRIRAQPWGSNLRLIAVSGWLSPEQRSRALASGYDAQVNKPIDMDALETLLQSAATTCRQPS